MAKSTKIRVRWDRIALALGTGVVVAGMLIWALTIASSGPEVNEDQGLPWCTDAIADAGGSCHGEPVPACVTEDSSDCYWDATTRGDGLGRSFVDVGGHVYYQGVK